MHVSILLETVLEFGVVLLVCCLVDRVCEWWAR
jgi:hypothetical protein